MSFHPLLFSVAGGKIPEQPFSPADIAGLKLWLDASQITGLSDGETVALWSDKSGESNDAIQSTEVNKPLFKTNITNGEPVVRFDGSNDRLDITNDASMQISTSMTFIAVVAYDNWGSSNHETIIAKGPHSNGLNYLFGKSNDNDLKFVYNDGSFRNVTETTFNLTNNQFYILTTVVNKSDNKVYFYVDGDLKSSPTDANNLNYSAASTVGAKIGANGTDGEFLNGDIANGLLYDSLLSDSDRESVESYLSSKYNITIS